VQRASPESAKAVFGAGRIKDSLSNRDYGHRLILSKWLWAAVLQEMTKEQEWSNFKNEVDQRMGREGNAYTRALHEVWEVMYGLQESETRRTRP
jgi:hypothetical protein